MAKEKIAEWLNGLIAGNDFASHLTI